MERLIYNEKNKVGIIFEESEKHYHILGYSNKLLTYSKKILINLGQKIVNEKISMECNLYFLTKILEYEKFFFKNSFGLFNLKMRIKNRIENYLKFPSDVIDILLDFL
tara:strand:+ start:801 stop:1124 length:324 start_codon:yes stop_codon:yes gene_type:complete